MSELRPSDWLMELQMKKNVGMDYSIRHAISSLI